MKDAELDVSSLAVSYRRLVLWFGVQLVIAILGGTIGVVLGETTLGALFALGHLFVILVTTIALMYYAYQTASALGSSAGVVWAIAMLIPLLNAITLLFLSAKATAACRAAGIPVGFLGPKLESPSSANPHNDTGS